ncbi:MAG: siderophore-interacting protein [Flavobacterium sp.]|nr:siderophore-interacting protein [Candidatus Neoflavobacterium equi]
MEIKSTPQLMKGLFKVKDKYYLSPHLIRIVLESDAIQNFKNARLGDNNKILLPQYAGAAVELPSPTRGLKEITNYIRTYTLRALAVEANEMTIDFVAHGTEGPASSWAIQCDKGDAIGVLMKEKEKGLIETASNYILIGDHTALPVISVLLEQMSNTASGHVILEVYGPEDVLELHRPAKMNLHWIFNKTPGINSQLSKMLENIGIEHPNETFVFAATEQKTNQEIQEFLRSQPIQRTQWNAFSYWKQGVSER